MSAATFAEAGEFETARQMLHQNKNANKKILLGTDQTEINQKSIQHVRELCRRIGAKLEVLHILRSGKNVRGKKALQLQAEEGSSKGVKVSDIDYTTVIGEARLVEEVARYVDRRRDILFVVLDGVGVADGDQRTEGKREKQNFAQIMQKIRCPVVVYSEMLNAEGV